MTVDHALSLLTAFTITAVILIGPVLAVAAIIGTVVGIVQTATQVNEPSIAYAMKVLGVVALMLALGPMLVDKALNYTRTCFRDVAGVVR